MLAAVWPRRGQLKAEPVAGRAKHPTPSKKFNIAVRRRVNQNYFVSYRKHVEATNGKKNRKNTHAFDALAMRCSFSPQKHSQRRFVIWKQRVDRRSGLSLACSGRPQHVPTVCIVFNTDKNRPPYLCCRECLGLYGTVSAVPGPPAEGRTTTAGTLH